MPTLYVVCTGGEFVPYTDWVTEAWGVAKTECPEWELRILTHADDSNKFDALSAYAVIARDIGPVLMLGNLNGSSVRLLEGKLADRCVSQVHRAIQESTAIYEAILDVIRRHHLGEPEVPRRFAVALMLVAKLEHMHYWGGNAKNFMSVAKLSKGNGLDEIYADAAHEIAEYLASDSRATRLLSNKLGDGSPKYACNNSNRGVVYEFLREWRIPDDAIMKWLMKDTRKVSTRVLDDIRQRNYSTKR